jgi:hypothetical protein
MEVEMKKVTIRIQAADRHLPVGIRARVHPGRPAGCAVVVDAEDEVRDGMPAMKPVRAMVAFCMTFSLAWT